jgi:hypothetical protein
MKAVALAVSILASSTIAQARKTAWFLTFRASGLNRRELARSADRRKNHRDRRTWASGRRRDDERSPSESGQTKTVTNEAIRWRSCPARCANQSHALALAKLATKRAAGAPAALSILSAGVQRPSSRVPEPVVVGAFSGIHAMALRSYLRPGAAFIASLVVFITMYHLLLFLFVK